MATGDKYKVLLAEDEEDARLIYLDILNGGDFEAEGAENGEKTLNMLEQKTYDILLLDIIMPDMDGISVLSEIKKFPAKYGTPKIVMLTNIGGDLAIEKALNIGANGYMLKSETEPEELLRTVKKYIEGGQNTGDENVGSGSPGATAAANAESASAQGETVSSQVSPTTNVTGNTPDDTTGINDNVGEDTVVVDNQGSSAT